MKLYTEEQVREAMFELTLYPYDNGVDKILEKLTPIELPSDEDIEDYRASLQQDEQRYENQNK